MVAVAVLASAVGGGVTAFAFTHLLGAPWGTLVGIAVWTPFGVFFGMLAGRASRW